MKKLIVAVLATAIMVLATISVSWGQVIAPESLGGTWETFESFGGTWE